MYTTRRRILQPCTTFHLLLISDHQDLEHMRTAAQQRLRPGALKGNLGACMCMNQDMACCLFRDVLGPG